MATGCSHDVSYAPGEWVYDIVEHGDSLYFSTMRDGIFRFHRTRPGQAVPVARFGSAPFRSLVFGSGGRLFAASYTVGVCVLESDSLVVVHGMTVPAWRIRQDKSGDLWAVGPMGIYVFGPDSAVRFGSLAGAHDLAFDNDRITVAHAGGIGLYERDGSLVRTLNSETNYWCIDAFDSVLVAGGRERLTFIENGQCTDVLLGPKGNIVWATARGAFGCLYAATQEGLFRYDQSKKKLVCISHKGQCVKTVFVDGRGKAWAGRYHASTRGE